MRVAKYWAGVRVVWNHPEWDWPMAHTIWAGSDESEEAARAEAEARAAELRARPAGPMGDGPRPRHDQDEYGLYPRWTRPEPMTQEILDDEGERVGAVTINGYGADVLNTASLAFVDVDLARGGGGLRAALRAIFGRRAPSDDEAVARATAPLAAWIDEDPARGARVYRTAAGLRYMILRPPMDPRSGESDGLMRALGADPMYRRLCRIQGSFRARLSPKPWRLGLARFPVRYEAHHDRDPDLVAWLERYQYACSGHAVCRLVAELGAADPPDVTTARMLALHDSACGVGTAAPLA